MEVLIEETHAIKILISAIGGVLAYMLGGFDKLLIALAILMTVDYLTGILKACHTKKLSSNTGMRGIVKKVMITGVVVLACILGDLLSPAMPIREITIGFFIANEGISILENAAACGLPLPKQLVDTLSQLTKSIQQKDIAPDMQQDREQDTKQDSEEV